MEESEISAIVQYNDDDDMVDYRRFVEWVAADDYKAGSQDTGWLLAEDVSREVSRVVGPNGGHAKRDLELDDVLGRAMGPILAEALRPASAADLPLAHWGLPLMKALGRRGGAVPAVKHWLESSGFVDRLAETVGQCAKTIHESGAPPPEFLPPAAAADGRIYAVGGQRGSQQGELSRRASSSSSLGERSKRASLREPLQGEPLIASSKRASLQGEALIAISKRTSLQGLSAERDDGYNKKSRASVKAIRSMYVGSYGLLTGFLRLCKENECFDMEDEEYEELLNAVEELSKQGDSKSTMNAKSEHFAGFDDDIVKGTLGSVGMHCEDEVVSKVPSESPAKQKRPLGRSASMQVRIDESFRDPAEIVEIEELLTSLCFDQQLRTDYRLDVRVLLYAFQTPHDLLQRYSIQDSSLTAWMLAMNSLYLANPYHSWLHAFDVFQFSYVSLIHGEANKFLNHQDVLALFIAEIGHDVGHLGVNNLFLKTTGHELAITYNDQSILENHHAAVVFKELAKDGQRVFEKFSKYDQDNVRDKIITAILATDMTHHFDLVDRFTARVNKGKSDPFHVETKDCRDKQKESKVDRRMLLQAFIHMADLGHCARPWEVHKHLVVALEEEMFRQGDEEAERGMPVSPLMNRSSDTLAGAQHFFFTKFVMPLLLPYTFFLKEEVGKELLDTLDSNGEKWKERLANHGKKCAVDMIAIAP